MKMRKELKRILAAFLAVVMVMTGLYVVAPDGAEVEAADTGSTTAADELFAGWYEDTEYKTPSRLSIDHEKTVDAGVLSVKMQTKENTDGTIDMRVISSVDSLDYKNVGFDVYYNGATTPITFETSTVLERISATSNVTYDFSPKVINTDSEYFVTGTIKGIKDTNVDKTFYIRPFWTTLDGTQVYGQSRYFTIEEATAAQTINIPVEMAAVAEGAEVTVTLSNDAKTTIETATATVAKYENGFAHLNIPITSVTDKNLLKSATLITVAGGAADGSDAKAVYRNLENSYTGTATTDTSWYDVYAALGETEFTIATNADLYGFASVVNTAATTSVYVGKTFYLIADIETNNSATNQWTPIGNYATTSGFGGIFDGQGHSISGLYVDLTGNSTNAAKFGAGFFGEISTLAKVKNLEVLDSTFIGSAYCGVIGYANGGEIAGVYSNSVVKSGEQSGGIVGKMDAGTIDNCWFDGEVSYGRYIGGIIGVSAGVTKISNSLVTGSITCTSAPSSGNVYVGGLMGLSRNTMKVEQCFVNAKNIQSSKTGRLGSVIGSLGDGVTSGFTVTVTHVYAVDNIGVTTVPISTTTGGGTLSGEVVESSELVALAAYTDTKLAFDRPETPKVVEGYWVATDSTPELAMFSSSDNSQILGNFRTDTEWAADTDATEYTISRPEELLGLASLVNATESRDFSGKTINLANDLVFNVATEEDAENWANGEGTDDLYKEFTSIGYRTSSTSYANFKGTFDGQGHSISGIYSVKSSANGLFVYPQDCTIQNLSVLNSYIQGAGGTASIGGWYCSGTFDAIYSNAIVKVNNSTMGGGILCLINARTAGADSVVPATSINDCWFDGSVSAKQYVGGILSYNDAVVEFSNCLNTGNVISNNGANGYAGGIIGSVQGANATMTDCLNAGIVTGTNRIGSAVGQIYTGRTLSISNSFFVQTSGQDVIGYKPGTLSVDGTTVSSQNPDNLIASKDDILGGNGYLNTYLDFERPELPEVTEECRGDWVAREGEVPAPKALVNILDRMTLDGEYMYRADKRWADTATGTETVNGTAYDTYHIDTVEELVGLAELVDGKTTFEDSIVYLDADLTVNAGTYDDAVNWSNDKGIEDLFVWNPIGAYNKTTQLFAGIFDGQGHTISGLYTDKTISNSIVNESWGIGLFAEIVSTSVIKDVSIVNSSLQGGHYIGAAAGRCLGGTIDGVYTDVIINSYGSTGGITGATHTADTLIQNCWFNGTITATSSFDGGIVGVTFDVADSTDDIKIEHCLSSGTIVGSQQLGGLVGRVAGDTTLDDSLSISSFGNKTTAVGTVVGKHYDGILTINDVYGYDTKIAKWAGQVDTAAVGTEGEEDYVAKVGDGKVSTDEVKGSAYNLADITAYYDMAMLENQLLDYNYWTARVGNVPVPTPFAPADAYPVDMAWYDADATEPQTYTLSDEADLYGLALLSQTDDFEGDTITLANDITVNDTVVSAESKEGLYEWVPMGNQTTPFAGTFDGQDNMISGLYKKYETSATDHWIGLFDTTAEDSTVKNLYIMDTYFAYTGTGDPTRIGSIAGEGYGKYDSIYSEAVLTSGGRGVGGFVGTVGTVTEDTATRAGELAIANCWYEGDIISTRPYQNDNDHDDAYIGGLIGFVNGGTATVSHSLYSGTLTSKVRKIGGITGDVKDGGTLTSTDNLITGTLSGTSLVGIVSGRVKSNANLSTLNINTTWGVNDFAAYDVRTITNGSKTIDAEAGTTEAVDTVVNGTAYISTAKDRFIGFMGESETLDVDASTVTSTDETGFTGWEIMKEGTPVLKSFVTDGRVRTTADVYDETSLLSALAPETTYESWFGSVEHKGDGNYVFTVAGQTVEAFENYCTAIDNGVFDLDSSNVIDQGESAEKEDVLNRVFTSANNSDTANDDLVVNATYMNGTIYITLSTAKTLSEHLNDAEGANASVDYTTKTGVASDAYTLTGDNRLSNTEFHMLELKYYSSSCYVMQLKNGHFVVIDTGIDSAADTVFNYLTSLVPEGKPVIEAWILSHGHYDHVGVFANIYKDSYAADDSKVGYADKVYVEGIYFNEPSDAVKQITEKEAAHREFMGYVKKATTVLHTSTGKNPEIYRMQAGQRYTFDDVTMDILFTQEQLVMADYESTLTGAQMNDPFNETSTWCMFTIDGSKLLTAGDASQSSMYNVMAHYDSSYLNVDVMTALHHGTNTIKEFVDYCHVEGVVLHSIAYDPTNWDNWGNSTLNTADNAHYVFPKEALASNRYQVGINKTSITDKDRLYGGISSSNANPVSGITVKDANGDSSTRTFLYYGEGTSILTFKSGSTTQERVTAELLADAFSTHTGK